MNEDTNHTRYPGGALTKGCLSFIHLACGLCRTVTRPAFSSLRAFGPPPSAQFCPAMAAFSFVRRWIPLSQGVVMQQRMSL